MFKIIVKMAAAGLVASVIAFSVTATPATDSGDANPTQPQHTATSDRLRVSVKGSACSLHAWPNFEPKCQFDVRETAGAARAVRVINNR